MLSRTRGGFPVDRGPWAGCSDTPSDPSQGWFAEEFFFYDDHGIGDDDFG